MGPRFRTSSQKRGRLIRVSLRRKPALARRQAKGHPPPVTNGSLPDSRFSRYTAETVFPQRVETATFIWNFHSFLLEAPGHSARGLSSCESCPSELRSCTPKAHGSISDSAGFF